MNYSNYLLFSVLENKSVDMYIIKLRVKMHMWVGAEIAVLELQSYYSGIDNSYRIEQYKQLL